VAKIPGWSTPIPARTQGPGGYGSPAIPVASAAPVKTPTQPSGDAKSPSIPAKLPTTADAIAAMGSKAAADE
jgi:hypothetical protein